ncbi:spore germination protein [Paenibacillus sp. GD4]|nr:spore germination protein [Paenibacillus sp. GD4]MDQ1909948.1 spore germination protein [Paenibacillus sp. GD4]
MLEEEFQSCSDVEFRELTLLSGVKGVLIFIDGLVKSEYLQDNVLRPLLHRLDEVNGTFVAPKQLEEQVVTITKLSRTSCFTESVDAILSGNALLLVEDSAEAIVLKVAGGTRRSVQQPDSEVNIRGPREGFIESLRTNTSLLRFKIKSSKLKLVPFIIGERTKTNVALAYIEDLADPKLIDEITKRLQAIKIDSVLESGYIEEFIEDHPYSPFPQFRYTERPDVVAAQLLEGRFAIFVDGTPFVLTAPITFWSMLQANEDYYERYMIGNLIRWLRYMFMTVALLLPSLYIAISTYHQDMLPSTLLHSISAAREAIPFPALVEALIMEVAFEALREAGIRLPKTIGQAVSILGALVIGQSAVQAGIVSAPMVIIVSLTGIASFTIPHFNMSISIRILRFPLMFLAGILGLFGIVVGVFIISLHLCRLHSFGIPYMSGFAPYRKNKMKDMFVRAPWWKMKKRSQTARDKKRTQSNSSSPEPAK